jgi:hypothetical protein
MSYSFKRQKLNVLASEKNGTYLMGKTTQESPNLHPKSWSKDLPCFSKTKRKRTNEDGENVTAFSAKLAVKAMLINSNWSIFAFLIKLQEIFLQIGLVWVSLKLNIISLDMLRFVPSENL